MPGGGWGNTPPPPAGTTPRGARARSSRRAPAPGHGLEVRSPPPLPLRAGGASPGAAFGAGVCFIPTCMTPPIRADSPLPPSQPLPAPVAVLHLTVERTRPSRARIVLYWGVHSQLGGGGQCVWPLGAELSWRLWAHGCGELQGRMGTPQGQTYRISQDTAMMLRVLHPTGFFGSLRALHALRKC